MTTPLDPPGPLAWLDDLAAPSPSRAPQASDPVPFRGVLPIPHPQAPAVGGGSFHVDRARAPDSIRELEDALAQLRQLRQEALFLGAVRAPTSDETSRDAALLLGAAAVGGSGSFVAAVDAGIRRLSDLRWALMADLADYEGVESAAAQRTRDAMS